MYMDLDDNAAATMDPVLGDQQTNLAFDAILQLHLQPNAPINNVNLANVLYKEEASPIMTLKPQIVVEDIINNLPDGEEMLYPMNDEEIQSRAEQLILATSADAYRREVVSHLTDRVRACAPSVNAPFNNFEDVWENLHVFHVFDLPSPLKVQREQFERSVKQKLKDQMLRMQTVEQQLYKTVKDLGKSVPIEDKILLLRLQCADMHEECLAEREEED